MNDVDIKHGWRRPIFGLLQASLLHEWLRDEGSLSARIVNHFQHFNLVRLNLRLARPHADETALLRVRAQSYVLVREVILRDGTTPLIFAHTVVARGAVQSAWQQLRNLGTRPLAQILFNDPKISAGCLSFRHLNTAHPLMAKIKQHLPTLKSQRYWARRRVFEKGGQRLIVTEVFLDAITEGNLNAVTAGQSHHAR